MARESAEIAVTYPAALLIIIAAMLCAGTGVALVRRWVRVDALRRHHEVGSAVFLQMGVIFAVLLAFVFTDVWDEYKIADQAISEESSGLLTLSRLAHNLPSAGRDKVQRAIASYVTAVIETEWPAMALGRASAAAEDRLGRIWSELLAASSAEDGPVRQSMVAALAGIEKQRDIRLFQMNNGIPRLMWALLLSFALALVGFLLFFGIEYLWSQVLFTATFAGGIAFVLILIAMLDYPFTGDLRLSSLPFQDALGGIAGLFGDAAPQPDGSR